MLPPRIASVFAWTAVATLAAIAMSSAHAEGGPPLVTDDPGTPGDGNWEINIAVIGVHSHQRWDFAAPDFDINYGWGEFVQLKIDVARVSTGISNGSHMSGLGATDFGLKWRFVDEEKFGFALSIYPQLSTSLSPSSARRGLAPDGRDFFLPVETSTAFGEFLFDAEVGRNFIQSGSDEWLGGVIVGHQFGSAVECGLELHGTLVERQLATLVNLGAQWRVAEQVTLLGAVGRELQHDTDQRENFVFYLGFQLTRGSHGNIR
jgi:hypothetical protein